jgi:hypothetical protein
VAFVALFKELKQPQGKADHSKHLSDELRMLHLYSVALGHQENFVFMWGSMEFLYGKSKRKFRPRTGHEGPEGE